MTINAEDEIAGKDLLWFKKMDDPTEIVKIDYTNYKGVREVRTITPHFIALGSNEWHPTRQLLLVAWCHDRKARRVFATANIHEWITR